MKEHIERRSPEFQVLVEYEASCETCGFHLVDNVQDANEKDALKNVQAVCEGWHYTTNLLANHVCAGHLKITTKVSFWT